MTVRKLPSGKWLWQCFPYGRDGKRIRRQFATKGEALSFERRTMNNATSQEVNDSAVSLSAFLCFTN